MNQIAASTMRGTPRMDGTDQMFKNLQTTQANAEGVRLGAAQDAMNRQAQAQQSLQQLPGMYAGPSGLEMQKLGLGYNYDALNQQQSALQGQILSALLGNNWYDKTLVQDPSAFNQFLSPLIGGAASFFGSMLNPKH
jgi:hypothetical protein